MTVRVLMSEGSSLSARESLTALGMAGYDVEVVDPNPLCLARFSKWCARLHTSPRFGDNPKGYLDRVIELLSGGAFDVLYPAHEQAYLFARHRETLAKLTHVALPPFDVFEKMQSKVGFARILDELGLPSPTTTIAYDEPSVLERATQFPVYLKSAFGTATHGTFRVESRADVRRALDAVRESLVDGILVQEPVLGTLGRAQAVFAAGELVGFHACAQIEEGVGGGDLVKESIDAPVVRAQVERLGKHLDWHGGMSLDFIVGEDGQPRYIDSNPRLAETGNGLAAGLNLPELLVRVSLGEKLAPRAAGRVGVRSFMGVQGLLRSAKEADSRSGVLRTIADLIARRGWFAIGSEELTPVEKDLRAALPLAVVAGALVVSPRSWRTLSSTTVKAYAAGPKVVEFVRRRSGLGVPPGSYHDTD